MEYEWMQCGCWRMSKGQIVGAFLAGFKTTIGRKKTLDRKKTLETSVYCTDCVADERKTIVSIDLLTMCSGPNLKARYGR